MKNSNLYLLDFAGYYLLHRNFGVTKIADNGERADRAVSLKIGLGGVKGCDDIFAIAYLETNGDPIVVADAIIADEDRWATKYDELAWTVTEINGEPMPLEPWICQGLREVCGIDSETLASHLYEAAEVRLAAMGLDSSYIDDEKLYTSVSRSEHYEWLCEASDEEIRAWARAWDADAATA